VLRPLATLAAACLLFAASAWVQFTPFEAAIAEFDAEVARGVAEDAAGCVSIAVFIGDEVVWAKGYGWADIENRVACSEETIGRTGSISKSFTAVLMREHGIRRIYTRDTDFHRFPFLEPIDPAA
jgi:CubicO group peptidase (beta-lactamase class C family)